MTPLRGRAFETMGATASLRIEMLGGLRVAVHGRAVDPRAWTRRSARGVVCLLALAPSHRLNREQLIDALWPDLDPVAAGNNLRKAVHLARRALSADADMAAALLAGDRESMHLPPDVQTDVEEFRSAAVAARRSSDASAYDAAIALYVGDLLPDDRYEGWVSPILDELEDEFVSLLVEQAAALEPRGLLFEAAAALRRAQRARPLDEDVTIRLMRVLALTGLRGEAVEVYERFVQALGTEIGTEPSLRAQALRHEIGAGARLDAATAGALWERIGDLRMRAGDLAGAAAAFESAIARGAPSEDELAGLHVKASSALLGLHDSGRAAPHADAAEALLDDNGARAARIAALRAHIACDRGDLVAADALARTAIALAEGGDAGDVAAANEAFAIVSHVRGEWPRGLSEEIERMADLPDADGPLAAVFDIHHCIAQYHLYGDGLWEAVEDYARRTLDRATALGAVRAQAFAWCLLGESLLLRTRYEEAEGCLQRSGEVYASLGERSGALAWQRLAELHVCRGDVDRAAAPLRRAAAIATVSPMARHLWGRIHATHGMIALRDGDASQAVRHARSAARAAARYGDCGTCSALLNPTSAEAYAVLNDLAGARAHAESAHRVASMFPSHAWYAMAAWSDAAAALAEGDRVGARAAFEVAAERYDAAGQPHWAAQARVRADGAAFALWRNAEGTHAP